MSRASPLTSSHEPVARPALRRRWVRGLVLLAVGLTVAAGSFLAFARHGADRLRDARAAYAAADYRGAIRLAQRVLNDRPNDPQASLLAARCLTRLGMSSQAEDYFARAGTLGESPEDLHDRAFALARGNQPERAVAFYEQILSASPADLVALKRLAAVHMAGKRWKPVLGLAERLAAIPGGEIDGATLSAIGHHELKHYEQASAAAARVVALDPELKAMPLPHALFWNNFALDLLALGRTADAETYLTRALREHEDANLMELLGLAHSQQGDPAQAEACWRKAVAWDPRNVEALLGLGRLALNRNQPREAMPWLERAVEASPDALEPVYNLARAQRLLGRTAEAERLERRASELRAKKPMTGGMGELPEPEDSR